MIKFMEKVYINFVFRICKRSRKTRSNSVTFYNITLLFKNFSITLTKKQKRKLEDAKRHATSSSLFPLLFHLLHSLQLLQYLQRAVLIKPCAQFQKSEHISMSDYSISSDWTASLQKLFLRRKKREEIIIVIFLSEEIADPEKG